MAKNFYSDLLKQSASWGNPSSSMMKNPYVKGAMDFGKFNSVGTFAQSPSLRTGITAGAQYALNANPYYATFNALTGGALDRGVSQGIQGLSRALGFSKRPPAQDAKRLAAETDYARSAADASNQMLEFYKNQMAAQAAQNEGIANYRRRAENMAAYGPSSRQVAGQVGAAMGPMTQAAEAARARMASGLSTRGLTPGSGIGAGAMAGVEQGLAGANAQLMSQIAQQIAERTGAMQDNLLTADITGRGEAAKYGLTALGSMADTATTLQQLEQQRRLNEANAALANREQRMKEQMGIGQALGQFGPDIFREIKRLFQQRTGNTDYGYTEQGNPIDAPIASDVNTGDLYYSDSGLPVNEEYLYGPSPKNARFTDLYSGDTPGFSNPQSNITTPSFDSERFARDPLGAFGYTSGNMYSGYSNNGLYDSFNKKPTDITTLVRLNYTFPNAIPGQVVIDPVTRLSFRKTSDGGWRKR